MARKSCYDLMDGYYEEARQRAKQQYYERHRGDDEYSFIGYIHNIEPISHGNELHFRVTENGNLIPRSEAP